MNKKRSNKVNIFLITYKTLTIFPKKDKSNEADCKKSLKQWIISAIISLILAIIIGFSYNTVDYMKQIISNTNDMTLALLGIIIGAFALYQALLSGKVITLLYQTNNIFKELNEYWLGIIMLFLFGAIINYILDCVMLVIPNDFLLWNSYVVSSFIAMILVFIYFWFTIRIFMEMRNFIVNLYNMFQIYNMMKILEENPENEPNDIEND